MDTQTPLDSEVRAAGPSLSVCGDEVSASATADDVARAIDAAPPAGDWHIFLAMPNGEAMEADREEGGNFDLDYDGEDGTLLWSDSEVDAELLKAIFASLLAGDGQWRSMARWEEVRDAPAKAPAAAAPKAIWAAAAVPIAIAALVALGQGRWAGALFLLALPVGLAAAIVAKQKEVRRAAGWKRADGRILRCEMVRRQRRRQRDLEVPSVEYEFGVGFAKHRGTRISIGEIMPESAQAKRVPALYPVGKAVTVYYDPADPKQCVLERDLPPHFNAIWAFVALVAAACIGGIYLILR